MTTTISISSNCMGTTQMTITKHNTQIITHRISNRSLLIMRIQPIQLITTNKTLNLIIKQWLKVVVVPLKTLLVQTKKSEKENNNFRVIIRRLPQVIHSGLRVVTITIMWTKQDMKRRKMLEMVEGMVEGGVMANSRTRSTTLSR